MEIKMKIEIPKGAKRIIEVIEAAGYRADIVGGCVRDALLSRVANDFDITTNAEPESVKALFPKTVDTGIRHGTVTVIMNGEPFEVTTYRVDGEYLDNRHPVSVSFTKNIEDDLARRDFTVNAMAYNERRGLTDVFGGASDLDARLIRAVGNAHCRFSEDALRILRGIRFSSTLDFDIEEKTKRAIFELRDRLRDISAERILTEWKKLLGGVRAYDVILEFMPVIEVFLPELSGVKMPPRAEFLSLSAEERQIALFASSSGAAGFESAAERLKMDNKMRDMGRGVLNNLVFCEGMSEKDVHMRLLSLDDAVSISSARVCRALGYCSGKEEDTVQRLIVGGAVRHISELDIRGGDLIGIGMRGESIGRALEKLLVAVADGSVINERGALIAMAKNYRD